MIHPREWLERLNAADLSPEAKTLLAQMLKHAHEKGGYGILVPDQYLIEKTGMGPKQIIKHLAEAFRKGWLNARVYAYGSTPQTSTSYILSLPPLQTLQTKKPRATRKAKAEMTLQEWEASQGCELHASQLQAWVKQKQFCSVLIQQMVEEFRLEMIAKQKLYADFRATFQTYLNKGYLSKKPAQVLLVNSPHAPKVGAKGTEQRYGITA